MSTRLVHIPGCDPIRLTRINDVRGLLVVHARDGRARRSNRTSEHEGYVDRQAADQLRTAGLVEHSLAGPRGADGLRLTPLGTRVIYQLKTDPHPRSTAHAPP